MLRLCSGQENREMGKHLTQKFTLRTEHLFEIAIYKTLIIRVKMLNDVNIVNNRWRLPKVREISHKKAKHKNNNSKSTKWWVMVFNSALRLIAINMHTKFGADWNKDDKKIEKK